MKRITASKEGIPFVVCLGQEATRPIPLLIQSLQSPFTDGARIDQLCFRATFSPFTQQQPRFFDAYCLLFMLSLSIDARTLLASSTRVFSSIGFHLESG